MVIAVRSPRNAAIQPHCGWAPIVARMYAECPAVIKNAAIRGTTRYQYIGLYPSLRNPTYAATKERNGGPKKNALRTLSSAITGHFSRIRVFTEDIEAKNIHTNRNDTPNADRRGALAGRFSPPRATDGKTTRRISGRVGREKPHK